jgi:two-component system CheB/CheR fusion protein
MSVASHRPQAASARDGLPAVGPDAIEEALGEQIDSIVPTYGYDMVPMVGLGGSAGSIPALETFFASMPPDSGMVFVVVLHLSPHHESALAEMLQRRTKMRVVQAEHGHKVEPNHVYVIPPAKHLTAVDGQLRLADLEHEAGRRVAVDLFFRSLADSHGAHAAAVVLSGADGDGALGIKRIKERGGLTIAQNPGEAEYDGMPRAAIASGLVDWVLNVAEMPKRIVDYVAREGLLRLPPEEGPQPAIAPLSDVTNAETAFREILVFLRARTACDFSYYKRATILRRISRRMQVNGVVDLAAYLGVLRAQPDEAMALLKDLLISVTNFFRDREAFAALEARIPEVFAGKGQSDTVRVWCPACATGEEVYSIAMLLVEHASALEARPAIQVFGCDLDDDAVQAARAGVYPEAITADVSEERLRRFFVHEHRGYRIKRELRELVLFATHDLLKDPPFSRVDLLSCRNLLIYLNADAQSRALDVFHFALNHEGLLFLGASESVDDGSPLFRVLDKKHRLYRRRSSSRIGFPLPSGPSAALVRQIEDQAGMDHVREAGGSTLPSPLKVAPAAPKYRAFQRDQADRASLGELHFKLIERFGPPSVLVDRDYDIQHLSDSAGRFLKMAGGQATMNLMRLAHPALRNELRALLFRAGQTGQRAVASGVPLEADGKALAIDIAVQPAPDIAPDFMLVTFDARDSQAPVVAGSADLPAESLAQGLERELEQIKGHLRATVEQYEASTEELKASNEELQAMNEELRSTTEELETSREELQAINEELTTVNQESKGKVEELGQVNSDLRNLMSATNIATLFLDRDMRVMRFTDSAAPIFNLLPSDVGRPLAHLQHHIDYPEMAEDAARVLEKLTPCERQVRGADGESYLARMLPYRTHDNRIAGIVLTFVDVTEREHTRRELAEDLAFTERLRYVAERVADDDGMQGLFADIVDAAIFLMHADAGTVQLLDEAGQRLRLLAARGFAPEMIERCAEVEVGDHTSCGMAVNTRRRAFVDYTQPRAGEDGVWDRWHRDVAGLCCALSTPLITRAGRPVGVITTHWRQPRTPGERELRFLDLLTRQAADAVEREQVATALRTHVAELERFNHAAMGREMRMIELKREINALAERLGEPPRYSLDFETDVG